jgi:DNA-3-methyladenine glycosylase II
LETHSTHVARPVPLHPRKHCLVATIDGALSEHAGELAAPLARMFDLHADPRKIAAKS